MNIQTLFSELVRWIRFNYYKSIAIARWKVTGKRQWILQGSKGRMYIYSNDQLRIYNKKAKRNGYKPIDIATLLQTALYGTPAGSTMERKRK